MTTKMVKLGEIEVPEYVLEAAGYSKNAPDQVRFSPATGEPYWYTTPLGSHDTYSWHGDGTDKHNYAIGNCFATKAEAIAANERQVALVRVQDKLAELTAEPLDWDNHRQDKWFIKYDYTDKCFSVGSNSFMRGALLLYGSDDACIWVINNMAGDLALILGVS